MNTRFGWIIRPANNRFDSATGTVATNSATATGAAYNGTLVNSPAWVASLPTVVTTTNDSGPGSLRAFATGMAVGATITFATNLSSQTILLTSGEIFLQTNTTIDASALPGGLQINGNNASRIFEVAGGASVTLKSLILTNGYDAQGGAICNDDKAVLTLVNCALANNTASNPSDLGGGAICNGNDFGQGGSVLTMTNCILSANQTLDTGSGAVSTFNGTVTAVGCAFSNNDNNGGNPGGGAVTDFGSSTMTFTQCSFVGNSAAMNTGGAINAYGPLTLTDCILSNNSCSYGGGAVQCYSAAMTNCIFSDNSTPQGSGGALSLYGGGIVMVNCTLSGNSAAGTDGGGGAIYAYDKPTLVMIQCTLASNSDSADVGGAIFNDEGAVGLNESTLSDNSAPNGGGAIYNEQSGTLSLNECTLWGNSAVNGTGGAIYNGLQDVFASSLSLNQCTLSGNSAANGSAGGIFNDDSDGDFTTLYNCIVSGNSPLDFVGSFSDTPNLVGGNPMLATLGYYGGPTQTMPPLPGSPAIGAGSASSFSTDQRGFPRTLGAAPDLGAVEGIFNPAGPGLLTVVPPLENGTLQFGFTNYSGMTQTVFATTNLALPFNTWTDLGPAIETSVGSGIFQFSDSQAPNYPQRFYSVRSP